jgi:hypothetical protein
VFAGGGPGYRYYFQIGVGLGVAWFPLGPREIYIPPYRASRTYITNVNISHTVIHNTTNIWNTNVSRQRYVNRNIDGAITAVPEEVFARAGHVARANVRVTADQAREIQVGGTAPPVTPRRESIAPAGDAGPPVARPPETISRREPTVRRTPAPSPAPFEQRRPALDRDPGRPPDPADVQETTRAQDMPRHREARPQVQQPQPAPRQPSPPVVRTQPAPRVEQPPPAQTPKATENRRRTIERERQQPPAPPPRSAPRGTEPAKQPEGRRR